jgi:glycosyltransferase involved in cell wall biosynthesis
MLGWEYPPHLAGGLGTACHGLATALARRGEKLTFVLPWVHGDEPAEGVRLVGARDEGAADDGARADDDGVDDDGDAADIEVVAVPAALLPYTNQASYVVPRTPRTSRTAEARAVSRAGTRSPAPRVCYGPDLLAEVRRYAESVRRIAKRKPYDVVHAHDWMTYPAGIAAAKAARAPLVVHVHSCEYDRSGPGADPAIAAIEQQGFDAAARIVCVSRYTARIVARRYRVDRSKIRVVHNAAPVAPGRRARRRRRIPEPVVLFLGRVTWQKGPEFFLEAAARVSRGRPDTRFVIAGSGDLLHRTIERAAGLGLSNRIHFTGFLRGADVVRAYRDADVYVLPSLSEPFGLTALEAAAHGVPVLISERSGVAEVLPSATTFDPWDVDDLAAKIERVLASPALRRRLVQRARREVAVLTWGAQAERTAEVYAEVRDQVRDQVATRRTRTSGGGAAP